jgi:putative transposase
METKEVAGTVGVDRNERNITAGNTKQVAYYNVSNIVEIGENTRSIFSSFKRNDVRVRKRVASKYGRRRGERIKQILHRVSKDIVRNAKANKCIIVFEDIKNIRKLYHKGSGQGRTYRRRMNSIPFGEIKRQTEYKAAWDGVPIVTLTRKETRGTTVDCFRRRERLQEPVRSDKEHYRQLWCDVGKRWRDHDLVAVMNISRRGWVRFAQWKGGAGEAMRGNTEHEGEPLILRVDAPKSGNWQQPKS